MKASPVKNMCLARSRAQGSLLGVAEGDEGSQLESLCPRKDFAIEAMELRSQDGETEDGLVVRQTPARNTAVRREWIVCLAVSGLSFGVWR